MAYEHKDGSGALFKADKQGNEARPDYRGDAKIAGTVYEIAGWIKEGAKGKFMSLNIKPKQERPEQALTPPSTRKVDHDDGLNEDIPF